MLVVRNVRWRWRWYPIKGESSFLATAVHSLGIEASREGVRTNHQPGSEVIIGIYGTKHRYKCGSSKDIDPRMGQWVALLEITNIRSSLCLGIPPRMLVIGLYGGNRQQSNPRQRAERLAQKNTMQPCNTVAWQIFRVLSGSSKTASVSMHRTCFLPGFSSPSNSASGC